MKHSPELLYMELINSNTYNNKNDLGEGMAEINVLIGRYWKPYYLLDHRAKRAYQWIDSEETLQTVTTDDIDWYALKAENVPDSVLRRAKRLSFHFPSFIYKFEDDFAEVKWQLNPDGMYYMDSDGYGMSDDDELNIYGIIDRTGKVMVKFRPIKNYSELEYMRGEAKALAEKRG